MRIFLFAAVVCAVLALICVVAPTTIGTNWAGWLVSSLLAYYLDLLFGSVGVPR